MSVLDKGGRLHYLLGVVTDAVEEVGAVEELSILGAEEGLDVFVFFDYFFLYIGVFNLDFSEGFSE